MLNVRLYVIIFDYTFTMDNLMKRLGSFRDWKDIRFRPSELAKAGFYNSTQGNTESITCYQCDIKIQARKFPPEGTLSEFHQSLSPACPSFGNQPAVSSHRGQSNQTSVPTQATTDPTVQEVAQAFEKMPVQALSTPSLPSAAIERPSWADKRSAPDHIFIDFMFKEENRLQSYFDFPSKQSVTVIPEKLAAAGLFYIGEQDKVQCPFCHGIITSWDNLDIPFDEHKKLYPDCPLVKGSAPNNIPIQPRPLVGQSACHVPTGSSLAPRHPQYMRESERFTSFRRWPTSSRQSPQSMARAGLFYAGPDDQVTCFHCGGSLREWVPQDVPWKEHHKYYPGCAFVQEHLSQWRREEPASSATPPAMNITPAPSESTPQNMSLVCPPPSMVTGAFVQPPSDPLSGEYEELQRRLEELQDRRTCKICMDQEANVLFVPCGHIACCIGCADLVRECPICRQPFRDKMRVYLA